MAEKEKTVKTADTKADSKVKKEKKDKKNSFFSKAKRFVKDVNGERKKVHWPTKKQMVNNTTIILVMIFLIGAFIWLADFGMGALTKLMVSL